MVFNHSILDNILRQLATAKTPQIISTYLREQHQINDRILSESYEVKLSLDGHITQRLISAGRKIAFITDTGKLLLANGGYTKQMEENMTGLKKTISEYLKKQIQIGEILLREAHTLSKSKDLNNLEPSYEAWNARNKLILEHSFTREARQHILQYPSEQLGSNALTEPGTFEGRRGALLTNIPRQKRSLELTLNAIPNTDSKYLLPIDETLAELDSVETNNSQNNLTEMKKIFLSHASEDKVIAKHFKDLLETIGVRPEQIFFSSEAGYGIKLGGDLFSSLKKELSQESVVIFVYSDNFFTSPISMCEMGATWMLTKTHIPVLIPPFDFTKVKGVFPTSIGLMINDKHQLNQLKSQIEDEFGLKPRPLSSWEEKRDKYIEDIAKFLPSTTP